jgi:hypothetical protein
MYKTTILRVRAFRIVDEFGSRKVTDFSFNDLKGGEGLASLDGF